MKIALATFMILFSTTAMASIGNSDRHDHDTIRIHNNSKFAVSSIVAKSNPFGTIHDMLDATTHSRDLKIAPGATETVSFKQRKASCVFHLMVWFKDGVKLDLGEMNLCRTSDIIIP